MTNNFRAPLVSVSFFVLFGLMGQDPTGVIAGQITDKTSSSIAGARVLVTSSTFSATELMACAGILLARGPALTNLDWSVTRSFRIAESTRLQFRAESFNALNHANFGPPIGGLNSPDFGKVFTAAPARLMQFALKLIF